jgi:hypothetical protein
MGFEHLEDKRMALKLAFDGRLEYHRKTAFEP